MWSTNLVFPWHTEHSALQTQAFTIPMWSPFRPKFASHFNSFVAKYCISQTQKRFCSKNFDGWLRVQLPGWNNDNQLNKQYKSSKDFWKCFHPISSAINCLQQKLRGRRLYCRRWSCALQIGSKCRGAPKKTQMHLRSQRIRFAEANSWRRTLPCHEPM